MTHAKYMREVNRILKAHDRQRKQWAQAPGQMHLAIVQEKNDRLVALAQQQAKESTQ